MAPAQLKQGVWTEYDSLLVASGKYTAEELAEMPTVGMWIQGDKGYIFSQFLTSEDPQAAAYAEKMAAAQATVDGTSGSAETVDQSQEATGDQAPADTADSTAITQEETMAVESSTENTGLDAGSAQGEM